MSFERIALAIVAKLPRPGTCKTRLVPPLSYEAAADVSTAFLRDTADNVAGVAARAGATAVALYAGIARDGELERTFAPGFLFLEQRGADFGARLANGTSDLFAQGFDGVCLIDSDSPTMPSEALAQAVAALRGDRAPVVIGAAADGGYYCLGMRGFQPQLFDGIAWSTNLVAQQTRARAASAQLRILDLTPWYDVDDGASLATLVREFAGWGPPGGYRAPATRAALERVGSTHAEIACARS